MAKQDGAVILLKLGTYYVTGVTDNSLDYSVDTFEVTTKDSNGHKEYKAGEDGATMSLSGLTDPTGDLSASELVALAKAKGEVAFVYGALAAGSKIFVGSAILTKVGMTDKKNEARGFSCDLQVTGELTQTVVTDAIAPVLESAGVNNATPTIIRLTVSKDLDPAYIVATTAFTPSDGKTVSSVSVNRNKILVTVNSAYTSGDTITIAYTRPNGAQDLRDMSGNYLASFTAESVTNNIV